MSKHEEFPKLTPEARAAHDAAITAIQSTTATISHNDFRRALRAFLCEAMKQAKDEYGGFHFNRLQAIANNLHNSPPPPPTLAQAQEAARQLGGEDAVIVRAFLATLGKGVQP